MCQSYVEISHTMILVTTELWTKPHGQKGNPVFSLLQKERMEEQKTEAKKPRKIPSLGKSVYQHFRHTASGDCSDISHKILQLCIWCTESFC